MDKRSKDLLEVKNELLSAEEAVKLARESGNDFALTPEIIKHIHSIVIKRIYSCAGMFRTWQVSIGGSSHKPPPAQYIHGLIEDLCDRVNADQESDPLKIAVYVLWRLNWIHPFAGGNGRTSRAVTYLILSARLGVELPGRPMLIELIDRARSRCTAALQDADAAWANSGVIDVSKMVLLLDELLKTQLAFLQNEPLDSSAPPI